MSAELQNLIPIVVTEQTFEPVCAAQVKRRIDLGEFDPTHDPEIDELIASAVEEFEGDTGLCLAERTLKTYAESICDGMQLQLRPIASITSIKYYDSNNTLQTLSTSVYGFDTAKRQIRLKYNQSWPAYTPRWDAWEITYVTGYADADSVPPLAKSAIAMLAAYRFENPDSLRTERPGQYEAIVAKLARPTYP